jgi:uncharacterized protein YigE (DUF2233 family)
MTLVRVFAFVVVVSSLTLAVSSEYTNKPTASAPSASPCALASSRVVSLRCVSFQGHLYAVADVNLQAQEIVFTAANDGKMEAYGEVVRGLNKAGVKPLLVTNGGIYGTDNRPLGLLITPQGKMHEIEIRAGSGNFSWDSAVFQILDDGTASIVAARSWQDSGHAIGATQSGPRLASAGKVNRSFQPDSKYAFRRTAVGVDQSNRRIVHLVVSRDAVTLFELATFMVSEVHCADALHLDGDLSAFYIPSGPSAPDKFVFSDPGERIVTVLSVVTKGVK